jgi:hypothetical protein
LCFCEIVKNITIAVDEKIHRRARMQAAEQDLSMSAYVAKLIEEAGQISKRPSPIEELLALRQELGGYIPGPKISRDELHERHRFR